MSAVWTATTMQCAEAECEGAHAPLLGDGLGAHPIRVVARSRVVWVHGSTDQRLGQIAAAQRGRGAREQLLAAGVSEQQIRWRLKSGLLIPEHRGVYAIGHADAGDRAAEISALLTRGPDALVCGHRAAGLFGIRPVPEGVDILVPHTQGEGQRPGVRIHRSRDLNRLKPTFVDGIPVVALEWALLEIAADLSDWAMEVALDQAFATGRVNRDAVRAVVESNPNRAGAGRLKELLRRRLVGNPTGSKLQERLLVLVRAAGLPDPQMDAPIGGGFSADMLWRDARVAAECDSFKWHASRSSWARDRRKDAYCAEHGIALVRVIDEDMAGERALRVIAELAGLIAARSQRAA